MNGILTNITNYISHIVIHIHCIQYVVVLFLIKIFLIKPISLSQKYISRDIFETNYSKHNWIIGIDVGCLFCWYEKFSCKWKECPCRKVFRSKCVCIFTILILTAHDIFWNVKSGAVNLHSSKYNFWNLIYERCYIRLDFIYKTIMLQKNMFA